MNTFRDIRGALQNWPMSKVILQYGSKFAAIGGYLQHWIQNASGFKIIIFSQYEHTLLGLAAKLTKADPANFTNQILYCKGNIFMREKILRSFNSTDKDSPKILLLSLAHNASGTHLPIATHVILVDPVAGSEENAKAIDTQAIARAHRIGQDKPVEYLRFIIKDTVEQDDYESTYGQIQCSLPSEYTLQESINKPEVEEEGKKEEQVPVIDEDACEEPPRKKQKIDIVE